MDLPPLNIMHARSFLSRLGGLLVRRPLQPHEALCLAPCSGVHTFFMRYAIDVVFLDFNGCVLKSLTLAPSRTASCPGAYAALEMCAGRAAAYGLVIGETVMLARSVP